VGIKVLFIFLLANSKGQGCLKVKDTNLHATQGILSTQVIYIL